MAFSRVVKIGDGVSTQFSVNFALDYISQEHVTARVGTEVDGLGDPVYRAITFLSTNLLQIAGAPAGIGVKVLFERTVPKADLIINYSNGDVLDEENLDTSQKQTLMAVQEVLDGRFSALTQDLDFGGFKGVNSGVPTSANDLTTKAYVDERVGDLASIVDEIAAVSGIVSELQTVAGIADEITEVASVSGAVAVLAANSAAISDNATALLITENTFVGDGVETMWALTRLPVSEANVDVYIGGAIQKTTDYSLVGSTLVITPAVTNGTEILAKIRVELSASELADLVEEAQTARDEVVAAVSGLSAYQLKTEKGAANGYASLDAAGLVPNVQLDLDYVLLSFAGASTAAAATDATTAWDAAVALAEASGKELRIRPSINADRRWIKLQPGRTFPSKAPTRSYGPIGIRGTVATGVLFDQKLTCDVAGDILIDGGLTLETVAGGYVSGHIGMKISATVADTIIYDVRLGGKIKFQNFGEYGLETYYIEDSVLDNVSAERIGVGGTVHWSARNCIQRGGRIKNVFPGLPAGDWQRNAYGVTVSQFTGKRQSTMRVHYVVVQDVPTWTGLDSHSGEGVEFAFCTVTGCSQGIAFENHIVGVTMKSCKAYCNRVIGFGTGGSVTKDGLTCYSVGGIIANSSGAPSATSVIIQGNDIEGCGERRPGVTGGGGGITVRHARAVSITDNVCRINQQVGINLVGATGTTDEILLATVSGNIVDGVTAHESVQKGIIAGSYVQGFAGNNTVNGVGSSANSYSRNGSVVYGFTFGTVSGFGTAGDNWWN